MAKPRKQGKARRIRSAAAALGGKISKTTVRLPITNTYLNGGDYTAIIEVGSRKQPVHVILDTGSSSLAIDGRCYDVTRDKAAKKTRIAQEVEYDDGSKWLGAIIRTDVAAGVPGKSVALRRVAVAVAYRMAGSVFGKANGILGLAYRSLDNAAAMANSTLSHKHTYKQVEHAKTKYIQPYFIQLEKAGLVADKFAFYTRRSAISMATAKPATNPLNQGFLILGGGAEETGLYTGEFQVARVLHDYYYNTHLKWVIVGDTDPIPVPPPKKHSGNVSNSIVDSGTASLSLDQHLFNTMVKRLSPKAGRTLVRAIHTGHAPMHQVHLADWPTITFVLEGALGSDVRLEVAPSTYWQTHSPVRGQVAPAIWGDDGKGGGQSILGLPLLNNYFTVFDRSVDRGLGVVSFAKLKPRR